jgi:hypothetical protein
MIFGILTLITALAISAVAIYYSVAGLVAIFAAASIPIMIMGGTLEIAKLVTAVWLHKYWHKARWWLKYYLALSVLVLMFITSMGIFGFLSKAHIQQTSAAQEQTAQLSRMEEEILRQQDIIARAEQRIIKGESDADKQDVGIQDKIDREQERIDSAYTRRQPSIDEQQAIITAQENVLANRVAVYQDEIQSLDAELERLNSVVVGYRNELAGVSVASVEEQIQPYIDQIAQLDTDLERINKQANEYEARISNIDIDTSAVDSLKTQIAAIEESIVVTTNKLQSTERTKIQEGQAVIGVTSDGLFGGNTRRALQTWVEAQQARIAQLQAQETDLRTQAQKTVDAERTRLTDLVTDLRGEQTTRIDKRKQSLLDTIGTIRNDAASGLETQRESFQAKIDSVLTVDIPSNRDARKIAQDTITKLRNAEDPRIESARTEIARIRAVAENEISNSQSVIERLRSQIQIGENVDLDTIIEEQNLRIKNANNEIDKIIETKFALEAEARMLEAEVGPVKYIAEFVYGEEADRDILEDAVRWVIITIIFVFDPLAVLLLIAAQYTFEFNRKPKDDDGERLRQEYEQARAQRIVDNVPPNYDIVTPPQEEEEVEEPKFEDVDQETLDNEFNNETLEKELREKEYAEKDSNLDWSEAKRKWKEENPKEHIKEWKQAYINGEVEEVPWEKYLLEGTAKRYIFKDKEEQVKNIALQEGYQQNAEQNDSTIWKSIKRED